MVVWGVRLAYAEPPIMPTQGYSTSLSAGRRVNDCALALDRDLGDNSGR